MREIASPGYVPTRVIFGNGALICFKDLLSDLVSEHRAKRILLLTGRRSAAKTWQNTIIEDIADRDHLLIENTQTNPTIHSVSQILDEARAGKVDLIIGLGGGSVLDTAKFVALLASSDISVTTALQGDKSYSPLPLIAIPTTSGTGSEVTSFATIWDDVNRRKYSLAGPQMYPILAIVDPVLTRTLADEVVASTALDALAHSIESSWSVQSSDESIEYGLKAAAMIMENARPLLRNPNDLNARSQLSLASLYAGMAIAKARTTIAHAISYPLTAYYGLSHGYACSLSLGGLLRFNAEVSERDCQDPRGHSHVVQVIERILAALGAASAGDGEASVSELIKAVGFKLFSEHAEFDRRLIAEEVMSYDRFDNNPRTMGRDQLDAFLASLA